MRVLAALAVLAVGLGGMPAPAADSAAQPAAPAEGEVLKVDTHAGVITIRHGPIRDLGMTDGSAVDDFVVVEPILLNALTPGAHVKFSADRVDGRLTITAVRP